MGSTHPLLMHASQNLDVHIQHVILTQFLISHTITINQQETSVIKQCNTNISMVSMIQNHHRGSKSPIINRKTCNMKFQNLFSVMRSFSWHMVASCPRFHWEQPYCSAQVILLEYSGSPHMYSHTHKGHFLMELQVHMQYSSA